MISTQVAAADTPPVLSNPSSSQLQPLLDAESITPKQAIALSDHAHNISSARHLKSSPSNPQHALLETITEADEAVLDMTAPQSKALDQGTPSNGTPERAKVQDCQ